MSKRSLRNFDNSSSRRQFLEQKLGINLENISKFTFSEVQVSGRNIENLIGATQVPLGVAGPLKVKNSIPRLRSGQELKIKNYYIPLATTEGALVASISRGCKAVTESGGAFVEVETVGITRGPVFKTQGIKHGQKVKLWINSHIMQISLITQKTSSHLKLLKIETAMVGKNLFVRFYFDTQDAMGMNMATIAAQEACKLIEKETQAELVSIAGNFDTDKKSAWLNFISGRGKKVWAEAVLPQNVVSNILKTTPQKIVQVVESKNHLGSIMSGSLGFNAHFANIIAAIFIATGQDPAHVVEGSLGVTTAELLDNGDLYFSIYMPSLITGIIGGGTHLPTQQEALKIMGVGNMLEYCQVVGAVVLAGELSLVASLAEGSLAKAHKRLGRKGR